MEYTIKTLNELLIHKFNDVVFELPEIQLKGEIIDCKLFKNNCGIGFKIIDEKKNTFNCKAWRRLGINIDKINKAINTNCIVIGNITQDNYMGRYDFILDLTKDIVNENNKSKIKNLQKECEEQNLFSNKKQIHWENIKTIGLVSKINTQGYNDFIKQFKIPLTLILKEIPLEGDDTAQFIINAINEFKKENEVDIIIIVRGGGNTIDISNSFDKIELFTHMKKSSIPILTAIGHEADKDEKLLITNISDLDFSTPSSAALNLNKLIIHPILLKINEPISNVLNNFYSKIEKQKNKEFNDLKKQYFKLNKQVIVWENIKNIGIISNTIKINLQHLNIQYYNILNSKTIEDCKNVDLLIISNNFTEYNFKWLNNLTNIPVIVLNKEEFDEEEDKYKKLFIQCIHNVDLNINNINVVCQYIIHPILNTLKNKIIITKQLYLSKIEYNQKESFKELQCIFKTCMDSIFGGRIINLSNEETTIIFKKNNEFYKVDLLQLKEKINISNNQVILQDTMLQYLENYNIKDFKNNIVNFNNSIKTRTMNKINSIVQDIQELDNSKEFIETLKHKKIKSIYCKNSIVSIENTFDKIIKYYEILLYYQHILENENEEEFNEILNFIIKTF